MNSGDSLMWRYFCLSTYLIITIAGGLACLYSPLSHAADLKGVVSTDYIPFKSRDENIRWTKIVVSSESGEKTVNIANRSFRARNVGPADSVTVTWVWRLADGVSGNRVYGLHPLAVTDISGTVSFTFLELGTIHLRTVSEIQNLTKKKNFSEANEQFERASDFYDKVRELSGEKWPGQADSWNFALYRDVDKVAQQGGLRHIKRSEKEIVRVWLKDWIGLCVSRQSLRSWRPRLSNALQSWSKFSKLAYSDVSDWPDKIPQDIKDEEVNRVFLEEVFRDWMIEDMVWIQDEVFGNQSVRPFLDGKPHLSALVRRGDGLGTSLSRFAQAITDFASEWR